MAWNDLIDRAKGWLNRPAPKATDAIKHDSFDEHLFRGLLDEAPALQEAVRELGQEFDYAEDLVRDAVMEFWKGDPEVRKRKEMDKGHLGNHAAISALHDAPETQAARSYTKHDRYGAAMGALGATTAVKENLTKHKELAEAAKKAKEERKKVEQIVDGCFPGVPGGGPGGLPGLIDQLTASLDENGDPAEGGDPAQAQMTAEQLEQVLEQLEQQEQAATQAEEYADQQAERAQRAMGKAVREAARDTAEQLEKEDELFTAWGVDDGELQRMSFEQRAEMAEKLAQSRIAEFSVLIGRFRRMAAAQQVRKIEHARDDIAGVELGPIEDMLAVELAQRGTHRVTRLQWLERASQERLLVPKFEGTEKIGDGAIIACIDTSGSMQGMPEAWSKAFALSLLDQAKRSKRDFVAILFSSRGQQMIFRFPKGQAPFEQVIDFTEFFYGGGTDFMVPMDKAVDILEAEFNDSGKQRADIVFITDDECGVTPDWMAKYLARKERLAFRTFGIFCGHYGPRRGGNNVLDALSDNVRTVADFTDPDTVSDIFQLIR